MNLYQMLMHIYNMVVQVMIMVKVAIMKKIMKKTDMMDMMDMMIMNLKMTIMNQELKNLLKE